MVWKELVHNRCLLKIVFLQFYCWEGHGTLLYATQHTPNPISNKANHCGQVNLTKIRPLSTNHFFKPMLPYKTKASVFVQGWSSQQHLSPFQYHSTVHSTEHLARLLLFHTMFVDIFKKKLANKFLDFLVVGISSKILRDMQGETIFEINRLA